MTLGRHPLGRSNVNRRLVLGLVFAPGMCWHVAAAPALAQSAALESAPQGTTTGINVTERGRVQLHVADMPLATALRLLSVQSQRNIVASPKVSGTVTANLYDVTFDQALDAILIANGCGFRTEGNFIYVHTTEELRELDAAAGGETVTRVFRLNYVTADDAAKYLTPIVGEKGTVVMSPPAKTGITSDASDGGGAAAAGSEFVVVRAPVAMMSQIERVLRDIDVRPRQVLIEATVVRAELKDDNALGIDFSLVGGVDLELLGATSIGGQELKLGNLPAERFELFNTSASTNFTRDLPGGGLRLGVIKDHVAMFLQALDEMTNTTVIANPKVLALNKQKGQVIVGRRDGYLTTTVTETQSIQTVEFLETGTQLIFRPFIGDDGFVRVELHPEDSVGVINAQGLPSEQTTEVTTNVLVRDGETILIGGLFREVSSDARSQVPGLGSLPGVGPLFRSQSDSSTREEVIILLTIHIVKDDDRFANESRAALQDVERLRVGLRRGLMWHGRERLAQWHYAKAAEHERAGRERKALWHADMALHNVPNFLPATLLKERILRQREWDEDGATARDFIYRLIAEDRGYPVPDFGRPSRLPETSAPGDQAGQP